MKGSEVAGGALPGLYVDTDGTTWHPVYYYFRGLGPWTRQLVPAPEVLDRNLHDPASLRPSLVQEDRYREYLHGPEAARFLGGLSPPMIAIRPAPLNYLLLLPGPYRTCSSEAALVARCWGRGSPSKPKRAVEAVVRHPWEWPACRWSIG